MVGGGGEARAGRRGSSVLRARTCLSVLAAAPGKFGKTGSSRVAQTLCSSPPGIPIVLPCVLGDLVGWILTFVGKGGTQQKIPATFTAETGWPVEEDCALVTSISLKEEWPLQLRHLPDVSTGFSAVSVGGGWAKFITDHNLGVGSFLTFEVVDDRRLVAAQHIRCGAESCEGPQQHEVDSGAVRDSRGSHPSEAENSHRPRSIVHPEVRSATLPQFRKTMRKTHLKKHDSSRIVSAHRTCWSPHHGFYWQFRVADAWRACGFLEK